jgi:hypothetical protein
MRARLILGAVLACIALLVPLASASEGRVEYEPMFRLLSPHTPHIAKGPLDPRQVPLLYFRCDSKEQILAIVAAEEPYREYAKYNSQIGAVKNVPVCRDQFTSLPGVPVHLTPLGVVRVRPGLYYEGWILELDNPKTASGKSWMFFGKHLVVHEI